MACKRVRIQDCCKQGSGKIIGQEQGMGVGSSRVLLKRMSLEGSDTREF
jgi:hypothetical protein